jgi:hypothetical protein
MSANRLSGGFWGRWCHRLRPPYQDSAPSLRETEKQRDTARRQAAEELAAIVSTPSRTPTTKRHGMCFQQTFCEGHALRGLPTMGQCKATGGKSWAGSDSNSCVSFGLS